MAAYATTVRKPDGLVLGSYLLGGRAPCSSTIHCFGILGFFSRYRFPTTEFVRDLDRPVLVIHGTQDEMVPFSEGQKLFHELNTEKYFSEIEGASHNNLHLIDPESYRTRVREFIQELKNGQDLS